MTSNPSTPATPTVAPGENSAVNEQDLPGGAADPLADPHIREVLQLGDAPDMTVIRVHGVGGSAPEKDLPGDFVTQVAGDSIAGFYRNVHEKGKRHSEAYSWGGLTSGRRIRALWVILFPFMLANMAGWASQARDPVPQQTGPVHKFRILAAKLAGLSLTLGFIQALSLLSMDVIAFQCGGWAPCGSGTWWLAPLTWFDLAANPAHRLLLGALVVMAVLLLIAILAVRSRRRYEIVPPVHRGSQEFDSDRPTRSAAELPGGLSNRNFWSGFEAHSQLSNLHLAAGVSQVAFTLAQCVSPLPNDYFAALTTPSVALPAAVLLLIAGSTAWPPNPERAGKGMRQQLWFWVGSPTVLLALALAAMMFAGTAAINQPDVTTSHVGQAPGTVVAFNLVFGFAAILFVPLLGTGIPRVWRSIARIWKSIPRIWKSVFGERGAGRSALAADNLREYPGSPSQTTRRLKDGIGNVHPFSIFATGFISAHVLLLSLILFVADVLSNHQVIYKHVQSMRPNGYGGELFVPSMVPAALSYIFWPLLLVVIVIGTVALARLLWATLRISELRRVDGDHQYAQETSVLNDAPDGDHKILKWLRSGAPDLSQKSGPRISAFIASISSSHGATTEARRQRKEQVRWLRRIARIRFLARSSPAFALLLNACATLAVLLLVIVWMVIWLMHVEPPWTWYPELAAAVALLIPPAMAAFVIVAWRDPKRRRLLGVLWDVGTFFPRSFQPFAPPSYAERAVPELLRRIWWLNDNGGEVVVAAHSQGSVLAAAAALQQDIQVEGIPRFGLVTYGSPLRKLYGEVFPAWWSPSQIQAINEPTRSLVIQRGWMNVYYNTDYIGGWVNVDGVNRNLSDPATSVYVYGQPPPPIRQHTGYVKDSRLLDSIRTIEKLLSPINAPTNNRRPRRKPPLIRPKRLCSQRRPRWAGRARRHRNQER